MKLDAFPQLPKFF